MSPSSGFFKFFIHSHSCITETTLLHFDLPTLMSSSMGRLSNNVSAVIQLWTRIKYLKKSENGDSTFSETSVRASATRYQIHEDIFNWHRPKSSPKDGDFPTLIEQLFDASFSMRSVSYKRRFCSYMCLLVRVWVALRLTVSRSVCHGVKPHLGLMTRYLLTVWQLRSCSISEPSLTRGRASLLS
jgi:hypothetical protein